MAKSGGTSKRKSNGKATRKAAKPRARRNTPAPRSAKPSGYSSAGVTNAQHPYTKLLLDPCEAKLTSAPLPGRLGAQAVRIPFRAVLTVPTATLNTAGATTSGQTVCSAMSATLFPHAMQAGGPNTVTVQGFSSESSTSDVGVSSYRPLGLTSLMNISSEIRPIAACIKLGYIGTQGNNSGSFIAYEGMAQTFTGMTTSTYNFDRRLQVPLSTLALDSWSTCDTTKTVEAKVNFAAADPYWQTLRNTSIANPTGSGPGVLDSAAYGDPDQTGAPIAIVAITGAVPGSQYLLSGAVVYEWTPNISLGMPAPQRQLRDPKVLQTVITQLGKYGRMLVGSVVQSGGSPPGLMIDLAMKAFSSLVVGQMQRPGPLRIGM